MIKIFQEDYMNKYFLMFLAVLLLGCKKNETYQVYYRGSLRAIMMGEDLEAKMEMDSIAGLKNLYALGAMENLKGEMLVLNSIPLISTVSDSTVTVERTFNKKPALLVYVQVTRWDTIKITQPLRDTGELESLIASMIETRRLTQPVPFILRGNFESLEWHVIRPKNRKIQNEHDGHKNTGFKGVLKNENDVYVLGFFSTEHQGIITHHDAFTHMHFKTPDDKLAGHVDNIILKGEVNLLLPGI